MHVIYVFSNLCAQSKFHERLLTMPKTDIFFQYRFRHNIILEGKKEVLLCYGIIYRI